MNARILSFVFAGIFLIMGIQAEAADSHVALKTPSGRAIELDIYNPGAAMAVVLAPGQGCGPRFDMFDAIGGEAKASGFTVVRLFWAYCLTTPQGDASDNLVPEKEDFQTALDYARQTLGFADANIFIGGKSLGTLVSSSLFQSLPLLRGLVLLTPLCNDLDNPKNKQNMFATYYPALAAETRQVLLTQGNADPLCDDVHFQEYVSARGTNFVPLVVRGDHGFGIPTPNGSYDSDLGARNVKTIAKWMFSWLH